jgi:hypothetical protein
VTPTASPTGTPTATPPPSDTLDSFLCYKAKRARGEDRFKKEGVSLDDQFQARTVDLSKIEQFCNPVEVWQLIDNEVVIFPVTNPDARLTCYRVKKPVSKIKPDVIVTNQFDGEDEEGEPVPQALSVQKRRTQLCVPSEEIVQPMPVEHFEMYRAKRTRGTPKFEKLEVGLIDQYISEVVKLTKPVRLGVPTDKNEEGLSNSLTHMTCYAVQAPRFYKRDVSVKNQFSEEGDTFRLTVRRPYRLCVPSYKELISEG